MFKGRIQMRAKLVRMLLVVSLLTMGLLLATPTPALACHGTITIVKETDPDGGTGFNFSGDLGSFTLNDDGSKPFYYMSAGWYNVTESVPSGWDLDSVVCAGGYSENITNGVKIHLESEGQYITCTFTNKERSITMEKTSVVSDNPLVPGSTITYNIVVSNPASSGSQTSIAINDPLPTGTSYVPGSSQVTAPTTTVTDNTVRDEFNTRLYSNNNGNMNWSGDWQEIGETRHVGPDGGEVQVSTDGRLKIGYNDYAYGTPYPGAWRMANLSSATSATFSFDYQAVTNASDDWLAVQVSSNGGGSWDTLETFKGSSSGSRSYNISSYASSNTAVRFVVTYHYGGNNDFFYADNVQIEFWKRENTTAPGGDPPNLADGYSLLPGESMTVTFQVTVNNPIPEGLTQIVNTACVTSDQVSDPICDTTTDHIRTCCVGATSITFKNISSGYVELWFYEGTHVDHPNAPYDSNYFAHFNNVPSQDTITLNASDYFASGYFPAYIYNYGSGCHWGWDIQLICDDPASLAMGDRSPDGGGGQKLEVVQVVWEGDCGLCLPSIGFDTDAGGNPLAAGTIVAEQWAAWGVHVTTNDPTNHPAMIFDSSNPTGEDPDLGTPNADFGGPGIGNGGKSGMPGENSLAQGKILIISEDNNPSDPDDNSGGGTITFTFDEPTPVDEVYILDIEETGSKVRAWNAATGGTLLAEVYMQVYGDNSFQVVPVNASGVRRLEIIFKGSGGVSAVVFCSEEGSLGDYVWNDVDRDGIQDGDELGISGVTVELYLDANGDGVPQGGELQSTDVTNENGLYLFTGLAAGSYIVKVADSNFADDAVLDDYFVAVPNAGSDDTVDSDGHPTTHEVAVGLASGENNMTIDFGFSDCEIGDRVWYDQDGQGDQNGTEPGFNGVDVYLYKDNGDGSFDRLAETFWYSTTTMSGTSREPDNYPDGIYGFDMSVPGAGNYWVWVDENTLPTGQWTLTTVSNPLMVEDYVSGDFFNFDFGYQAKVDLALTKTLDTKIYGYGDLVTFSITVTNEGNVDATGVQVIDFKWTTDTIEYESADSDGVYDDASKTVIWGLPDVGWGVGNLPAGASATVHITFMVTTSDGQFLNDAEIYACDQEDVDSTPNNGWDLGFLEDDIDQDGGSVVPTAVTLSSFAARSSAGGPVSEVWLGLAGLMVLSAGSFVWTKRRAG